MIAAVRCTGSARRAYRILVRPHTDSALPARSSQRSGATPVHLAAADKAAVAVAITGRTIVLQRRTGPEDIRVVRVSSVSDSTANVNDGDKGRAVKAEAMLAVR